MHTGISVIPISILGLRSLPVCIWGVLEGPSLYAYGDPCMHTGLQYTYWDHHMHMGRDKIQREYRDITISYHLKITQSHSNSITVILAALAVPVAARAAKPTSFLACTAVCCAVTLAVALYHSLTSNGRYKMSSFCFGDFW